ncbi:MAG: hypothetical protein AAFX04_09190 [Pseudomonadota bacterium]
MKTPSRTLPETASDTDAPGHRRGPQERTPAIAPKAAPKTANDNQPSHGEPAIDTPQLRAALRLFARYGFGSAAYAAHQAERCFWQGNSDGQRWWTELARILDRKLMTQWDMPADG